MMTRPDLSDSLIHFTKDSTEGSAANTFCQIVTDGVLKGGIGMIKGGYSCVCFSEAPLTALKNGLVNPAKIKQKYAPLGFMVKKDWLFEQGGRPVIYQPESEFSLLPDSMRWRHVTYEPPSIDFSWEREWRIHCDELLITPDDVKLIFLDEFTRKVIGSSLQDYFLGYQSRVEPEDMGFDLESFDPEEYFETRHWEDYPSFNEPISDVFKWEPIYLGTVN
jgi:hypothetical protein